MNRSRIPLITLPESFRGAPLLGSAATPRFSPIPKARGVNWGKIGATASIVGAFATIADALRGRSI